jgi:hypothetical protein
VLELGDLRKLKKFRDIEWDGPKNASVSGGTAGMEQDNQ